MFGQLNYHTIKSYLGWNVMWRTLSLQAGETSMGSPAASSLTKWPGVQRQTKPFLLNVSGQSCAVLGGVSSLWLHHS